MLVDWMSLSEPKPNGFQHGIQTMIDGQRVLAVIPARGGSKAVPRKNIRLVGDRPLLTYTIEAASASAYIDRILVSSEDAEILRIAAANGAEPMVRPEELAADDTPGIAPVLHALEHNPSFELVVLLQPTSPLRSTADIDGCIEQCTRAGTQSCVSVQEVDQSPYWMYRLDNKDNLVPIFHDDHFNKARRQELPKVFVLNGAVYVARVDWLLMEKSFLQGNVKPWVMPAERSLDIDTERDLQVFSDILSKKLS
jgi:CMP-N,N'-diacetyllegionaminic acid synthase